LTVAGREHAGVKSLIYYVRKAIGHEKSNFFFRTTSFGPRIQETFKKIAGLADVLIFADSIHHITTWNHVRKDSSRGEIVTFFFKITISVPEFKKLLKKLLD
jgi:hypothetical protein